MTFTENEAAARRALVRKIRASRIENLKYNYLKIEERITPCCESCKYNKFGLCAAAPAPGFEPQHRYGHVITDYEDLCIMWEASYDAFCKAFERYNNAKK